ncbi:hypothetical protein C2845_PM17G06160 [Panicum miliaceum]|uniref:Uncharacterized protein n=1 Tax=Panicum miliaceum TaxID=4540 RepID=A0A3L6Q4U1_PANMI|nr:hypothetical protein C2845_PM17G06160 [Panicum miliaceum]
MGLAREAVGGSGFSGKAIYIRECFLDEEHNSWSHVPQKHGRSFAEVVSGAPPLSGANCVELGSRGSVLNRLVFPRVSAFERLDSAGDLFTHKHQDVQQAKNKGAAKNTGFELTPPEINAAVNLDLNLGGNLANSKRAPASSQAVGRYGATKQWGAGILNPIAVVADRKIVMADAFIEVNDIVPNVIEEELDLNVPVVEQPPEEAVQSQLGDPKVKTILEDSTPPSSPTLITSQPPASGPSVSKKKKGKKAVVIVDTDVRLSLRVKKSKQGFKTSTCVDKNCLACDSAPPALSPSLIKNMGVDFCKVSEDKLTQENLKKKKLKTKSTIGPKVKKDKAQSGSEAPLEATSSRTGRKTAEGPAASKGVKRRPG